VTRDVTAWACLQLFRTKSLWYRADATGKWLPAWARLGPFSMLVVPCGSTAHRRFPALRSRRRSPNRAAWRFPDWTAVGFRCSDAWPSSPLRKHIAAPASRWRRSHARTRTRFLGSAWLWRPLLAGPGLAWVRCLASDDDSLVARAGITGGDLNPTCLPSLSAH